MTLSVVILAAGQGKRMHSTLPKVLHPLGGKPILAHIIAAAQSLNPHRIYVVYGHEGERIRQHFSAAPVQWVQQTQQLGTGHAVLQALPLIPDEHQVLTLAGDVPLITTATLQKLVNQTSAQEVGLITAYFSDPAGLGRIVRNEQNQVIAVIEDKDATPAQRQIQEINSAIIIAPAQQLRRWLPELKNHNIQNEYYLPDIILAAVAEKMKIVAVTVTSAEEVQGINDRAQLAILERCYQQQIARQLLLNGVTLKDPARFDARGELHIAQDVTLDVNVVLEGKVTIGAGSYVGPNCLLRDVVIGEQVLIKAHSVIEEAEIGNACVIGPFARIRPDTRLANDVHIGNFVEIKKSLIGQGSKINHLSYVGDATIGEKVNIGAGAITCNYDGANKYPTVIGDNVFIGSATQLVAPVTIGAGATIGAGSTIVRDAPPDTLTLSRAEQKTVLNWQRKKKSE
jgi:bifunctional UDP-N-acetylglucosamine pyrophosphorylase/glucosamine-1-phosphate N-acetyltransferase